MKQILPNETGKKELIMRRHYPLDGPYSLYPADKLGVKRDR
jgi:hypothetical protein